MNMKTENYNCQVISKPCLIDAKQLDYSKEDKTFCQEASMLRFPVGEWPLSINIQGKREKKLFLYVDTHKDLLGSMTHAEYASTDGEYKLVIFND
jgi:hypothetical protein